MSEIRVTYAVIEEAASSCKTAGGQIESMFEASSPHRANLLNGSFNQIGVGVTVGDDGQLYVTEFFVGR